MSTISFIKIQYFPDILSYRLSWENPAPGPVNECLKATEGIYKDAKKWGLDTKKVILAGKPFFYIRVMTHVQIYKISLWYLAHS